MDLAKVLLLMVSVVNAVLGAAVLLRSTANSINVMFAAFAGSVSLWAFGLAGFLAESSQNRAELWAKLFYVASVLIVISLVLLAQVFPYQDKLRKWFTLAICIPGLLLILGILFINGFIINGVVTKPGGNEVVLGPYDYALFAAYFIAGFYSSLLVLYHRYIVAKGKYRSQIAYVASSIFVASIFAVYFNLILPGIGNYKYVWVGPLFSVIFASVISYAIVRHRLFDLRSFITRTLAYSLTLATFALIYGVITFVIIGQVFPSMLYITDRQSIYLIIAILLGVTFHPLKRFFDSVTDRIFYRGAYNSQDVLDQLSATIVKESDVTSLLEGSLGTLSSALKPTFIGICLNSTHSAKEFIYIYREIRTLTGGQNIWKELNVLPQPIITDEIDTNQRVHGFLSKNDIALTISLETSKKTIGYVFFGYKQNSGNYSRKDTQLIRVAADELSLAVQNAVRLDEIKRFNATLQGRIDKATSQLRSSNAKLQSLDEAKDEFISMASHQLRTPLTSVKGYLSMVLEGDAGDISPTQRKLLEEAYTSSQRMVYLIGDFLNVSRLKTGKFVIELSKTNLADIIVEEIEQLQSTATARQLQLVYVKPERFPLVELDENKIRQVIMNFLDNAIFYSKSGGTITVTLTHTASEVIFKVKDAGIGVPAHERPHLFTKFFRASNARQARPDGTGIGLFMAKKAVVAHGGAIIFESLEGKGSTFGFRLPIKRAAVVKK